VPEHSVLGGLDGAGKKDGSNGSIEGKVPALIQRFKEVKGPTVEKPYELASLLAVVAAAATQLA
jgi:hypothetical protein